MRAELKQGQEQQTRGCDEKPPGCKTGGTADRGREGGPKADVLALVTRVIMRLVARM